MKNLISLFFLFFLATVHAEVLLLPVAPDIMLEATITKPPGPGPFPLVVINHGKDLGDPRRQGRLEYPMVRDEFLKRGYAVVVPMRRGFADSTGPYQDPGCDLYQHGLLQGEDIAFTIHYLVNEPWVDKDNILVIGQSYGGLATLGFATFNYPGVKGYINFAGGLKFKWGCDWKEEMLFAFRMYGLKAEVPTLWFYGRNDSHFDYEFAKRLEKTYTESGGHVKLVTFGPFKSDSHGLISWTDGVPIWWPETQRYLERVGLPF